MSSQNRFDILVDSIYGTLNERVNRVSTYFRQSSPPGAKERPDEEKLQEYMQIRDNPEAWAQIIKQRGMKNAIKYEQFGSGLQRRFTEKAFKLLGVPVPEEFSKVKPNRALLQALGQQFAAIQQNMHPETQPQPTPQQQPQQQMMPPEDPNGRPF